MPTICVEYNGDFAPSPQGGLLMVSGWDEVRQRLERAIMTVPQLVLQDGTRTTPDYVFDPTFGFGLRVKIGSNPTQQDVADVEQSVLGACSKDPSVSQSIAPVITRKQAQPHVFIVYILVTLVSGQSGQIVVQVT